MDISFVAFVAGNPNHRHIFAELTREWLVEYDFLEPSDEKILADPENHILIHDGTILLAYADGKPVGTGVLFQCAEGVYEMGKMAVTPSMRGNGIGRRIAGELINIARSKGVRTLYLGSNSNLHQALGLYRSLGFVETPVTYNSHYDSCDINMVLDLAK